MYVLNIWSINHSMERYVTVLLNICIIGWLLVASWSAFSFTIMLQWDGIYWKAIIIFILWRVKNVFLNVWNCIALYTMRNKKPQEIQEITTLSKLSDLADSWLIARLIASISTSNSKHGFITTKHCAIYTCPHIGSLFLVRTISVDILSLVTVYVWLQRQPFSSLIRLRSTLTSFLWGELCGQYP